jgi:hypothetical protein
MFLRWSASTTAFRSSLRYFEFHHLPPDWQEFLDDFQRHWPTDEDIYVDFVRDTATTALNAASSAGIPFACITTAAISAEESGSNAVRKASCVRALTVLRRLAKRGIVAKSGTSRNAQWALVHQFANMSVNNC